MSKREIFKSTTATVFQSPRATTRSQNFIPNKKPLSCDSFGDTIYYTDGSEECEQNVEAVTFHQIMRIRPSLAMLGAKIHDLVTAYCPIPIEHFCVRVHNYPTRTGIELLIHSDAIPSAIAAYKDVCQCFAQIAEQSGDVEFDDAAHFYAANNIQSLFDMVLTFCEVEDINFDARDIEEDYQGDYQTYHAIHFENKPKKWETDALDALQKPWVIAALPDKLFLGRDALLKEAYRIKNIGIYDRDQIQNAIDLETHSSTLKKQIPLSLRSLH